MKKRFRFECIMSIYIDADNLEDAKDKLYDSNRSENDDVEIIYETLMDINELEEGQKYLYINY